MIRSKGMKSHVALVVCLSALVATIPAIQAGDTKSMSDKTDMATFGGGCFWCTEALFQMLPGVKSVTSGFAGGTKENPTYKEVCTGTTGHAEVIQVEDRKSTRLNSSHTEIYTLSLHDALPIWR